MRIEFTDEQLDKLNKWIDEQDLKCNAKEHHYGVICSGYSYILTPTTLGDCIVVRNNFTKEEINLTDYSTW